MKVLLTGGGSGGHITPLLAVAQKLKQLDPSVQIIYVGERRSKFADMTASQSNFDAHYRIFAGKLRRYHGESWLRRLFDVRTNFLNLRDILYVLIGTVQAKLLLQRIRPDVILLKGGFVGVPIGLATRRKYPMVTHDSDALPGLANRIAGRHARWHATGMPAEYYGYPAETVQHVGVLVGEAYCHVTKALQAEYKKELNLPHDGQLLFVTGGSLGAQKINQAVAGLAPVLLEQYPKLQLIHQVGQQQVDSYKSYQHDRLTVVDLVKNLHVYSGAADVVVTRAGANTLAELGVQGKACIVVPNPLLTGGHQVKNAQYLADKKAVVVVDETSLNLDDANLLHTKITELLDNAEERRQLADCLRTLTITDAAQKLAELLLKTGRQRAGE